MNSADQIVHHGHSSTTMNNNTNTAAPNGFVRHPGGTEPALTTSTVGQRGHSSCLESMENRPAWFSMHNKDDRPAMINQFTDDDHSQALPLHDPSIEQEYAQWYSKETMTCHAIPGADCVNLNRASAVVNSGMHRTSPANIGATLDSVERFEVCRPWTDNASERSTVFQGPHAIPSANLSNPPAVINSGMHRMSPANQTSGRNATVDLAERSKMVETSGTVNSSERRTVSDLHTSVETPALMTPMLPRRFEPRFSVNFLTREQHRAECEPQPIQPQHHQYNVHLDLNPRLGEHGQATIASTLYATHTDHELTPKPVPSSQNVVGNSPGGMQNNLYRINLQDMIPTNSSGDVGFIEDLALVVEKSDDGSFKINLRMNIDNTDLDAAQ